MSTTSDNSSLAPTFVEGELLSPVPKTKPLIVARTEGEGDDRVYVNHQTVVNIYTNNKSILDYLMSFLGRGSG